MKRLLMGLLLLIFVTGFVGAASAENGLQKIAVGARSAGMAGVDLAIATDATALLTNPAGLIRLPGHRIDFGSGLFMPSMNFENDLNDQSGESMTLPSPLFAYGFKLKDKPFAGGIGVFTNSGMGVSKIDLEHALLGQGVRYFSQIQMMKFAGAIAWAPHETVSLAVAPQLLLGRLDYQMPYTQPTWWLHGKADPSNNREFGEVFQEDPFNYDEVTLPMKMQSANAYGVGARLGFLWVPHEVVQVGLMYQMQINMEYRGHARIDFKPQMDDAEAKLVDQYLAQGLDADEAAAAASRQMTYWGIEDDDLNVRYDSKVELNQPRQAGLGLAVRPVAPLLIGIDTKWIEWSRTMEQIKVRVKRPNERNGEHIFGNYEQKLPITTKWHDQLVAALGVQYEVIDGLCGRVGYNYGTNPVPDDRMIPLFPGITQHHVAGGLGYRHGIFEVNAAYEYALTASVEADDDHKVAADYAGSTLTQGGSNAHLMFSFMF